MDGRYEEKPLVSTDYINDKRSSIVDALSTMVIDDTMVIIPCVRYNLTKMYRSKFMRGMIMNTGMQIDWPS